MKNLLKNKVDTILERALTGYDLSAQEGITLLKQTEPSIIAAIHTTADKLRFSQVGDTVTYIINRNINFTNICEQHCSFCAFRRDDGDTGAYSLDWTQIVEKTTDAVKRGATEICMQGGLNPEAKIDGKSLNYYLKLVETIKQEFPQLHL
ncbi:MAG: radical SAM protein, partial [Rivularia sp. (in: cyanobacteria)]